ncbi:hypothetical protein ABZ249_31200 [Nocardiopsis sp. NPDC006139]|uniref:hypothetical protein n=1 Tax=unclassified Nocardiopsis TaxID=2649073 RepID=UPI0033AD2E2D
MSEAVLSVGLHPSTVDFDRYPGVTEEMLRARIAEGDRAVRDAGFDVVTCQVTADPDEAEAALRACLDGRPVRVVMIGAGLRMAPEHTLLFERVVNLITSLVPGVVFCFNTSPDTTLDALRRWVRPDL